MQQNMTGAGRARLSCITSNEALAVTLLTLEAEVKVMSVIEMM